jgi:hypothetical protein
MAQITKAPVGEWAYDPIPRYFLFVGETCVADIVFEGFKPALCNDWKRDGEVWFATYHEEYFGRYSSLNDAQEAIQKKVTDRGLKLVSSRKNGA